MYNCGEIEPEMATETMNCRRTKSDAVFSGGVKLYIGQMIKTSPNAYAESILAEHELNKSQKLFLLTL